MVLRAAIHLMISLNIFRDLKRITKKGKNTIHQHISIDIYGSSYLRIYTSRLENDEEYTKRIQELEDKEYAIAKMTK